MSRTLTIFHVTDVHARVGSQPEGLPGLDALVRPDRAVGAELFPGLAGIDAVLQEEVGRLPPGSASMLVCCGDLVGREMPTDRQTRGGLTLSAMKLLAERSGVDAAVLVVGNHEVDHGVDRMQELLGDASPFVVAAGNLAIDGSPVSSRIVDVDVSGLRVGVLALTTVQTASQAPFADRPRLHAQAPVPAARAHLADAAGRDLLLAAVHLFDQEDEAVCSLDGVDLLIGGHTHARLSGPLGSRGVHREKAGAHGLALGRAVVQFDDGRPRILAARTALLPPDVAPAADSPIQRLHDEAVAAALAADPEGARGVAVTIDAIGSVDALRTGAPCPLGRTVAHGLMDAAAELSDDPIHFGFINAGNVRVDLIPIDGRLPLSALHDTLAYGNELVVVELSPEALRHVLRTAVANLKLDLAGWLHTAGLSWHVAADGSMGPVTVQIARGHRPAMAVPIESLPVLRGATIDWLAAGNHQLDALPAAVVGRPRLRAADAWATSLLARRIGDRLAPLAPPPPTSSVDEGFRCTDTREVLETLDIAAPGALAWAFDRLAAHRSGG